jgi:hypothetical protein
MSPRQTDRHKEIAMKTPVYRLAWTGFMFVCALALAPAAVAAPVAMVTDLQGKAAQTGEGRTSELSILSDLDAGAQVQLQAGATMVVLYTESGSEFVFKGPASVVFGASQPEVTSGAKAEKRAPALGRGGRDIRIKPVGLVQGAMVMRGLRAGPRIVLLAPRGLYVVEASPEFRWQAPQSGLTYTFELNDDAGATVHQTQTTEAGIALPANVKLREGMQYSWEVSARLPDGTRVSNIGKFSLATPELRAQIAAVRPESGAPFSSRVLYAAWLDQMNLKDEARKYWQAAASERPDEPRLKTMAEQ